MKKDKQTLPYSSCYHMAPVSSFLGSDHDVCFGMVNQRKLNTPIISDDNLSKTMRNPENSNFFGCLNYAFKRYLETGDESFKPFILLQTLGGGADIAGAIMEGMFVLHTLCENQELQDLYQKKKGQALDSSIIINEGLLEFCFIGCPEKRVSHKGVFKENDYQTSGPHHAFVNGSLDTKAGLMPEHLENSLPVKITHRGEGEELSLIRVITPETRFDKSTLDEEGNLITIQGTPIEDTNMLPVAKETLGIEELHLLALHGTIGEAREELHAFLKEKVSHSSSGSDLKGERSLRPCFIWAPDTGGDTFGRRDRESLRNMIISPVNEAYNLLVLSGLLEEKELELSINFTPFAWSTDGESNASVSNDTIENLHKDDAILGAVYHIPAHILQYILVEIFGVTKEGKPLLESHANLKAIKLLWKASVFYSLGLRPIPKNFEEFMKQLPQLESIGEMNRTDVPVLNVETIVKGSREGSSRETMFLVDFKKGVQYFCDTNGINLDETKGWTYVELRQYLEKHHLVVGENQLPSYMEYELMKAQILRNPNFNVAASNESMREYLIPKNDQRQRLSAEEEGFEGIADLLTSDDLASYLDLRNQLVKGFIEGIMNDDPTVSGFLRMNSPYIMAYFAGDYEKIHKKMQKNPGKVKKITESVFKEICYGTAYWIERISLHKKGPNFLTRLSEKIALGVSVDELSEDERFLATALKVLRINPHVNRYILESLQKENEAERYASYFLIAQAQRKVVQGYLNRLHLSIDPKKRNLKVQKMEGAEVIEAAKNFQAYVKQIGTYSGEYEKIYKSFSNVILHSLATDKISTAYAASTLLYFILPENLSQEPYHVFSKLDGLAAFNVLREALYKVRKSPKSFINLLNGMLYRKKIRMEEHRGSFQAQDQEVVKFYKSGAFHSFVTGFFLVTSNMSQLQLLFDRPLESLEVDSLAGKGHEQTIFEMRAIMNNCNGRMEVILDKMEKLRSLLQQIEQEQSEDIRDLLKNNNYILAQRIMGGDHNLYLEFKNMLQEGLLVGKSMKEQILELIESYQSRFDELHLLSSLIMGKIPESLQRFVFGASA